MEKNERIEWLRRTISHLTWDLGVMRNEELKAQKTMQLDAYRRELDILVTKEVDYNEI